MNSKKLILVFSVIILFSFIALISAARLPTDGGDEDVWGAVLNDYLTGLAGDNATLLNSTMVNGTNIYSSAINTTHILDSTIGDEDISDTTNLTLGGKITFTLGEIIDNIVDGWVRVTGGLNVTGGNFTVGDNVFFVDSNSNRVGIGTTAPLYAIEARGSNSPIIASHDTTNTVVTMINSQPTVGLMGTLSAHNFFFTTGGIGRGFFDTSGNFSVDTNVFYVDAVNDRVGIGTSTPTNALTVIGDVNISGCYELANGTIIGGSCVSDSSLKKNISDYEINLSKLLLLNPRTFEFVNKTKKVGERNVTVEEKIVNQTTGKLEERTITVTKEVVLNFPSGTQKGFIADEVELIYPEFVKTDEFGLKRIIYGFNWIFELWKQNQEQQNQIERLETAICSLDKTNTTGIC